MKFKIKNTLEKTLMFEESNNWEVMLSSSRTDEALLLFEARYVTSMSRNSYEMIMEKFEDGTIDDVKEIIIDDWSITFR